METLKCHLSKENDLGKVAVVIGAMESVSVIEYFILQKNIRQLSVYFVTPEIRTAVKKSILALVQNNNGLEVQVDYYNYKDILEMEQDVQYDTVYFDDGVSYEYLEQMIQWKPVNVMGIIIEKEVPYFDLWEQYRNVAHSIFLRIVMENGKWESLEWQGDKEDIELSIVFPVYNVAKYLPKCIDTVTAWKAPYVEFIFVNDGSPDNSTEIIQAAQEKDARIKLVNKPNGGCASARKMGMDNASGRYVGFFDPDDFVAEDMFFDLLRRALAGNYDVSYCGYREFYETTGQSKPAIDAIFEPYSSGISDPNQVRDLILYARVAIWRGIYKRKMLVDNHISFYTSLPRFDDLPFKVEIFACAKSVITVPKYMYYYRLQRPGQDVSCNDKRLCVHFDIFNYLDASIGAYKDQSLLDRLQIVKYQTHVYALSKIKKEFVREYYKLMRKDMKKNMSDSRTQLLIRQYLGKKAATCNWLLQHHMLGLALWQISNTNKPKNVKRTQKIQKNLEELM